MNGDIDNLERRCPRLGGPVRFAYCRTASDGEACLKILDCWWERFDVAAVMQAALPAEAFQRLVEHRQPPNKVASLVDLIRQARQRTEGAEDGAAAVDDKGTANTE